MPDELPDEGSPIEERTHRDPITEFFDRLNREPQKMLPDREKSTIRFDVTNGDRTDHWFLRIENQRVQVSSEDRPADCVVRIDSTAMRRLATGEGSDGAMLFRNELTVEGDLRKLILFRRLVPPPPDALHPRQWLREKTRRT